MITFKHERGTEKYTEEVRRKLANPAFLRDAKLISCFDPKFTDPITVGGSDILEPLIKTETEFLRIGFYTQKWIAYKFTPVNAYVDYTGRNMFLNTRNLWRSMKDIEETVWHELVHVSDSINTKMVYWHGDNKLAGKGSTAPVKFARWAVNWINLY